MKFTTTKINMLYVASSLCFLFYILTSCGVNSNFVVNEADVDKFYKRGGDIVSYEELKAGSKLYIQKCGNCHNLILPSKYTQAEWEQLYLAKEFEKAKVEDKAEIKQISYFIFAKSKHK